MKQEEKLSNSSLIFITKCDECPAPKLTNLQTFYHSFSLSVTFFSNNPTSHLKIKYDTGVTEKYIQGYYNL